MKYILNCLGAILFGVLALFIGLLYQPMDDMLCAIVYLFVCGMFTYCIYQITKI